MPLLQPMVAAFGLVYGIAPEKQNAFRLPTIFKEILMKMTARLYIPL